MALNSDPMTNPVLSYDGTNLIWKAYTDTVVPGDNNSYFPNTSRKQLKELVNNVSEADARKILNNLFSEVTKENSDFRLSEDVEAALTQMILDGCSGEQLK